jgi:hypothetical protein
MGILKFSPDKIQSFQSFVDDADVIESYGDVPDSLLLRIHCLRACDVQHRVAADARVLPAPLGSADTIRPIAAVAARFEEFEAAGILPL